MREFTISRNDAGQRLDRFTGKTVPLLPDSLLQKYIRLKRIKVNHKGAKRDTRLIAGDVVQMYINDEFFEKPSELCRIGGRRRFRNASYEGVDGEIPL